MGVVVADRGDPLASALVLAVLGSRLSRRVVAALGVGSIGVSRVLLTILVAPTL